MQAAGLLERDGHLWVSGARLTAAGIGDRAIACWWERKRPVVRCYVGRALYVRLDTVPARSRALLPPAEELRAVLLAAVATQQATDGAALLAVLVKARDKDATEYRAAYADTFGPVNGWPVAQRRAVWARLLALWGAGAAPAALWQAHTALGQGKAYKVLDTFRRALKDARAAWRAGNPDAFVLHGNLGNAHAALDHQTLHEYLLRGLWSSGLALGKTAAARHLAAVCQQLSEAKSEATGQPVVIAPPSDSWVKTYLNRADVRTDTDAHRYGADYAARHLPYMPMRPALYANDQWQIDGWNVPFYHRAEGGGLSRLVVVVVMDVYSRRLLGYAFADRENGAVILAALRKAIETAGALPSLIVSDKHSFNKTPEAAYLKQQLLPWGCDWTVSTNPKAKSVLERFFGQFEQRYCLTVPGFVGAGPADRRPTARLKPERHLEQMRAAHVYERGAALLMAANLLAQYNADPLPGRDASPTALYEAGAQPGLRAVGQEEVMRLFWKTRPVKVARGGITLQREAARYYFPFTDPATLREWQGREVLVRYDEDYEQILVLCPDTEKTVALLFRPDRTNAVPAHQTGADHSRRAHKGHFERQVKETGAATHRRLAEAVEAEHGALPYELVAGVMGVPKAQAADARVAYEVAQVARAHGVDPTTTTAPRPLKVIPADFAPSSHTDATTNGRDPRRPYAAQGSHKRLVPYDPYADEPRADLAP